MSELSKSPLLLKKERSFKERKDGYKKHKSKVYSNEITKTLRKEISYKNAKTKETDHKTKTKEENKKRKKEV
jgi:hypothetical protein